MNHVVKNGGTENRQSRANPLDVAWLAGIVDGEGCLQIFATKGKDGYWHIRLGIKIANTSRLMMEKVQRIVQDISYKRYELRSRTLHKGPGNLFFHVEVTKQSACVAVCKAILPHLTVKKSQAELMLAYCESRKTHRHRLDGYTEFEMNAGRVMSALKREAYELGGQSEGRETKHDAPLPEGEAIVRSSQECEVLQ